METVKLKFSANIYETTREQEYFETYFKKSMDKREYKQTKILCELLCTEVFYLYQLEILIHFFIVPLYNKGLIKKDDQRFSSLFASITHLYRVNGELYDSMKAKPLEVSDAFNVFAPFLKLYSIYACDYKKTSNALQMIEKKKKLVSTFIKRQETRPEVGTSFLSLLISPIQRVPRYRLLLKSLLDNCHQDDPSYATTLDALKKVEDTANHINKVVTEAEESEALLLLARRMRSSCEEIIIPGRKILKQGCVMKTQKNGNKSQRRYLVLMTDVLLVCKGCEKGPLSISRRLPLRRLGVEPIIGSAFFKIMYGDDCLVCYTSDSQSGQEWIQALDSAIQQYVTCRRTLRRESSKFALR